MAMKQVVLIDHDDSFTYNIVDYLRRIDQVDLTVVPTEEAVNERLRSFDKIILSPGPGSPEHYPNLLDTIDSLHTSKHILGICLGCQAIGMVFGAKNINIYPVVHGQSSKIQVLNESPIFRHIPEFFRAGLYHSWVLDNEQFPDDLDLLAISENKRVMAIGLKKQRVYGVQFHPESFITEYGLQLLNNFIDIP